MNLLDDFKNWVLSLSRLTKRVIVLVVDSMMCILASWIAFYLRLDQFVPLDKTLAIATYTSIVLGLPIFIISGLYRDIFRYSGLPAMTTVAKAMTVYTLGYAVIFVFVTVPGIPRSIGLIQPLLLLFFVGASRSIARIWLGGLYVRQMVLDKMPKALIYGAGGAGRQLASAMTNSDEIRILGFLDDDERLHGQVLNGLRIYNPSSLKDLVTSKGVSSVLLALPTASRRRRTEILEIIKDHKITVRTLPDITDMVAGRLTFSDLRELDIDDLLGRTQVSPNHTLLSKNITDKTVLVTGAGGSIGAELSRQALSLLPKKLLLLDNSEFALYTIHKELEDQLTRYGKSVEIIPLLASVQDAKRISEILSAWHPDTIYHAAAYKHVTLVEHNTKEGIKNNVFGTYTIARAAVEASVSNFVLISTDKAVRPTNVMGASKRLSEMTLQAMTADANATNLCMVRFGNVLDSSGSVVPKFRKQIRDGGPVTVTHAEVSRFFMTIPEAAQLVIQASALARGGDIFILDMGEPVKIMDLANRMISLSGLSAVTPENPDGDIRIEVTGLRPGEKLCEELLIHGEPETTEHPKILRAKESFLPWPDLEREFKKIKDALDADDVSAVREILRRLVGDYCPNGDIVDWVHTVHNA